jgi:hypothetical protein
MNRTQCLLFILCGTFATLVSGQNLKGIVVNAHTKAPIPYANVGILNKNIGTVTNDDGTFQLDVTKLSANDTIRVSYIGYQTFDLVKSQKNTSNETQIRLFPKEVQIPAVQISNTKSKHVILGNTNKSHSFVGDASGVQLGNEFGTLIKVKHPGLLEQIRFHIVSTTFDSLVFRVNIYDVVNGYPCHNILKKPIIIRPAIKTGDVMIDVSEYGINLDEDFVVCLETIKKMGNEKSKFYLSIAAVTNPSFSRPSSQGKWEVVQYKKIKFGWGLNVKMSI